MTPTRPLPWGEFLTRLRSILPPVGSGIKVVSLHGPHYVNAEDVERFLLDVERHAAMRERLSHGEQIALALLMDTAGL